MRVLFILINNIIVQGGKFVKIKEIDISEVLKYFYEISKIPRMSGKEEKIAELMPTAKAPFQVLEGTAIRMNEDSCKPLLELFENCETYVKAWNPERETEYGLYRIPIPEFDWSAFREGLVNAFCHRDYTILGRVRVSIDDEGLSISNPGGFIDGVNLT